MDHIKTTLASDDEHDLALERCDCGQYALSMGPMTIQLDEDVMLALRRMLLECVPDDDAMDPVEPFPGDVQ